MKTSKVKQVHECKKWNGGKGDVYYCNVTLENSDEINIGKKSELKIGDEITYELTGGDDAQQLFKKAKAVQPEKTTTGFIPKNEDAILYQTCLKISCDIFVQTKSITDENDPAIINDFAMALALRAKSDIKKLKDE